VSPPGEVVRQTLALAERYYASGDAGLPALTFRIAVAVRAARLIYSAIGAEITRRGYDVSAARAVVPGISKLWLVFRALRLEIRARLWVRRSPAPALGAHDGR
jgi:phytoene synthase